MHTPKPIAVETSSAPERRREGRFPADEVAKMKVLSPLGENSKVRVLDISKGGLKLRVPEQLQPGTLIQVHLKSAIAMAEVRYCVAAEQAFDAGLKFLDVFWKPAAASQ